MGTEHIWDEGQQYSPSQVTDSQVRIAKVYIISANSCVKFHMNNVTLSISGLAFQSVVPKVVVNIPNYVSVNLDYTVVQSH
jgi:hypothetical protein